jgi:hypothetical protein
MRRWEEDRGAHSLGVPAPQPKTAGGWRAYAPLALLVIAGTVISGVTLVRILGGVGRDRVLTVNVPEAQPATTGAVPALEAIDEAYIKGWVEALSSEELGGRDTPSRGLDLAQERVAAEFRRIGLLPPAESAASELERPLEDPTLRGYLAPFRSSAAFFARVPYEAPDGAACALELDGESAPFSLFSDYVPLARSSREDPIFAGEAYSRAVFAGFGIDSDRYRYDDFAAVDVEGKIAVVISGEPEGERYQDTFLGAEVSAEACVWNKLDALSGKGAAGALVVDMDAVEGALDFHWTRAYWNPPTMDQVRGGLPTLRVTRDVASRVLGVSVEELRAEILSTGAPLGRVVQSPKRVELSSWTKRTDVELRNVVGVLPGSGGEGPAGGPFIVVGAHLDHIGVGPRGRVGRGADDNASGVAAMLAMARTLSSEDGRSRLGATSVVFCAFTGEEDGRVGSAAYVNSLVGATELCPLMINLDMVGAGDPRSAVVLGLTESPSLIDPFHRVVARGGFGLDRIQEVTSKSFFLRSDHYSFYEAGIPALFLFEAWPHETGVYHTWRDGASTVSARKVTSIARLGALVAFEVAR